MMLRPLRLAAAFAATVLAGLGAAQADTYPTRPVRVVIPFGPGGPTDGIGRPFLDEMSKIIGQPFVVENRAGGTGSVGAEAVARATGDGYTLMLTPLSTFIVVPVIRKVNYDPVKDFIPIARFGDQLNGLVAHPSLGVKTVADLVKLAKSKPGEINYASAGTGGIQHLRMEVFKKMAGIDIVHVPYKGSGEAMPDMLAGNIQVMMDVIVLQQAKAGKLTLLATVDSERNADFPDVPTLQEAGYPQYDMPNFYVFAAPAGTPQAVINTLNAAAVKVAQQPEFAKRLLSNGYRLAADTPAQVKDRLATLAPKFAQHMKEVDFKVE